MPSSCAPQLVGQLFTTDAPPACDSSHGHPCRSLTRQTREGWPPIWTRSHSTDFRVLQHALAEYPPLLSALPDSESIRTVLDAGANGGYSASIFARALPAASHVVALEPHPENHAMLVLNVALLPVVFPLKVALWGANQALGVEEGPRKQTPNNRQWSYVTRPPDHVTHRPLQDGTGPQSRPAMGIPVLGVTGGVLLQQLCLQRFDFVKIDIEVTPAAPSPGTVLCLFDLTPFVFLHRELNGMLFKGR